MSIEFKKINDEEIIPLAGVRSEPKNLKGKELFDRAYCNVMLWAKKNSGKTVALNHIIKKRTDKSTVLIFFVPTIYNDATWIKIIDDLESKGYTMQIHTDLKDQGVDQVEAIVKALQEEAKEKMEKEKQKKSKEVKEPASLLKFDSDEESDEVKPRKKKKTVPRYLFIFDDISDQLRSPSLAALLKKNRHFKCMTLLSSQDIKDATPTSIKNVEYWMIWGGADEDRLMHIYKLACVWIPFKEFAAIYKLATEKKYSFLYIDTVANKFRRNFTDEIIL